MDLFATISADLIAYTSITSEDKLRLNTALIKELERLSETYKQSGFFGRVVQGDFIECVLPDITPSFRIALILKTFIKSLELKGDSKKGFRNFKEHGARVALAIAPLELFDPEKGIIDGEAIYLSGREIKKHTTSGKKKVRIKETCFFLSANNEQQELFSSIFTLIDTLLSKCSARQCEVIYNKLNRLSEKEISKQLGIRQSTISQHSTSAGWHSIEKSVNYFEKNIQ